MGLDGSKETFKEIYKQLPKWLQILFWICALILLFRFGYSGYSEHIKACNQNKHDEFLFWKCYQKNDPIKELVEKTVYRDTCLKQIPSKKTTTLNNPTFTAPTSIGDGNTLNTGK